jgi:hypothetical protein
LNPEQSLCSNGNQWEPKISVPAKDKSRVSSAQRAVIAAGRIQGKTSAAIASEAGLSRSTVKKQANDRRTKVLIQRLKERDEVALSRIWTKALNRTEKLIAHADPIMALRASKIALDMVTAGDPPLARLELNVADGERECTLEELLKIYGRAIGNGLNQARATPRLWSFF